MMLFIKREREQARPKVSRLYLILLMALMTLTGFAQETGDAVYVYQKDGNILSFMRSEISEFCYGFEDADGVTQEEPVMQWIVLGDSICKIPLVDIDSISFVTPETVYQPGVTRIEMGLMDYVERSDSLTIYFAAETPASLLPKVGDKLVTTEMNDLFPAGFAGVVSEVNGTVVTCEAVDLEDVFESYYDIVEAVSENEDEESPARRRSSSEMNVVEFTMPTLSFSFGGELQQEVKDKKDLVWKVGSKMDLSLASNYRVKSMFIVKEGHGTFMKGSITGNFETKEIYSFYGGLEWEKTLGLKVYKKHFTPFAHFYVKPGVFINASVTASLSAGWTQQFSTTFNYDYNSTRKEQPLKTSFTAMKPNYSFDVEGALDGSLKAGLFLETGLTTLFKLGSITVRGDYGVELLGHAVLYNSDIANASLDTKAYEILKSSDVEANAFFNSYTQAKLFDKQINNPIGPAWNYNLATWNLVPKFSNLEFLRDGSTADGSATLSGNCLMPVKVGLMVSDKDGNKVDSWNANDLYQKGGAQISTSFSGLKDDVDYVLNPKIVIFDIDMKANPPCDQEVVVFPVRIVSFEQTGSDYSKEQGYVYEGIGYHYKFDATTTVELSEDAQNVKDWGYIYHDFYGVDKRISCANMGGRIFEDTRYAYYYNDPYRMVELSPYVQYEGESEIREGKAKVFEVEYKYQTVSSCPDNKHPHAIDLGLPSGTLWSCCNVGADAPEDYGGYFQYGETSEINGDASFRVDRNTISGLSDIAGTDYDVAHVKWGGNWQIPTVAQITELLSYNKLDMFMSPFDFPIYEWSKHMNYGFADAFITPQGEGGQGYLKLYGPNGNFILFPAAGSKETSSLYMENPVDYNSDNGRWVYNGSFWLSTNGDVYGRDKNEIARAFYYVWDLGLGVNFLYLGDSFQSVGYSVRPVMMP